MAIIDSDYNSNTYFFLTNFSDVLKAGKNSFIVNPTPFVIPNASIAVKVYDIQNNELPCGEIKPTNAKFSEQTNTGQLYYVNVPKDTINGIGRIEIRSIGLAVYGQVTGSIAYYNNRAYEVPSTTRLPLTQAPASSPIEQTDILWRKHVLIDTTRKTDSEVRFFDSPFIKIRPEIYSAPLFPTGSYILSSGSFSTIAVTPKNNADGDYDYQFDDVIYQLYWKSGNKFSSSMEHEYIRLKTPTVTKFTYTNFGDNRVEYQGVLNTDFIAKIKRVINETSLLLDIPFSTVSDLIGRTNEDSSYTKNNLTELKGYTVNDDADKQTVFHKKNFYVLSLSDGQFEIFHNDIPAELPRADSTGFSYFTSILNVEFNNLRTFCGALDYYKIYGRNLNSPESKTLLIESKIEPEQVIRSNKFDNGLRANPSHFYNSSVLSKHWFVNGACTFYHTNEVFMNGAYIGHADNSSLTDYVIYKDNTVAASQNATYVAYSISPSSYWYANAPAFINYRPYPTASYQATGSIPLLNPYGTSQENLLSGVAHDSNSIKLRANTLYKFGMRVKALPGNSSEAKLYVYYISGNDKKIIGFIDNAYNLGANELYEKTFFSSQETFGTIILVPSKGNWHISSIILEPYQNIDYSIDSFSIKIPVKTTIPNQFYELDIELYDAHGRLAYGKNSYTSTYNKRFMPLKNNILIDPTGITTNLILDGGNAN